MSSLTSSPLTGEDRGEGALIFLPPHSNSLPPGEREPVTCIIKQAKYFVGSGLIFLTLAAFASLREVCFKDSIFESGIGGEKRMLIASWMKNIFWIVWFVVGLLASAVVANAQQPDKVWKIGVLVSSSQSVNASRDEALRQGLRDFGYEEGKNITMEYRYAEGKTERLNQLARELVEQKVDVIVVGGTRVATAAKKATSTIPIVVAGAGDLVEAGLIKSFMFPGGNVTGVARMSADFFGARLKLIKEILPKTSQVSALSNPKNPGHGRSLKDAELGARAMGLTFQSVTTQSANELESAVSAAAKSGSGALFVMTDALFNSHLERIAQASIKNRLPSVYDRTGFVEAGGLMSYGVNLPDLSRRAAEYIDQIFKGAKPGDLTLVQPTKFDLALNLKTAQQIGVTFPPDVINRAVKVVK
jgi:putative tryptophan/tyrosine transport system substrate-binding protein